MMTLSGEVLYVSIAVRGESIYRCCDYAPKTVSEQPTPNNIVPCNIEVPQTNVLDCLWAVLVVFDFGKRFALLQFPELDLSDH